MSAREKNLKHLRFNLTFMTLILTEISPLGIAMAADSAVTERIKNLMGLLFIEFLQVYANCR